jgi:hypothetical protein
VATVERYHGYYYINVLLPMSTFTLMSALQWVIDRSLPQDRLGVTLTLVLTAAAYKLAISAMVPAIAYLTILDKCALASPASYDVPHPITPVIPPCPFILH